MQPLAFYLLKVIACSGILLLYYRLALRNKRFHYYNRFYLLATIAASILLPLLQVNWFTISSSNDKAIALLNVIYVQGDDVTVHSKPGFAINWQQLPLIIYGLATVLLMAVLLWRIHKIYTFKKRYTATNMDGVDFINTDLSQAPFSFLQNLFWRNDIDLNETTGRQILQHELTHIRQKHTWDKLCMQIVLSVFWINPFYWFIQKELYLLHEFIADEKAIENNDGAAFAAMLLTSQYGKSIFSPAQSFAYSPIKRRLFMLTNLTKPRYSYLRRLMVLPLLAIVLMLFAFRVQKKEVAAPELLVLTEAKAPFKVVIDAGHGGNDDGVAGYGAQEKDITLNIAKKMERLCGKYNVQVALSRSSNSTMSEEERTSFAYPNDAAAFISLHVSAATATAVQQSGMDAFVSGSNKHFQESKLLGSAVLQNLSTSFKTAAALKERKTPIAVLSNNPLPAILLECGFMTSKADVKILTDDKQVEIIAQKILEGIAQYANHTANTSYDVEQAALQGGYTDTAKPGVTITSNNVTVTDTKPDSINTTKALVFVDGKEYPANMLNTLDANSIESIKVLKGKNATDKYGPRGARGVIEITMKAHTPAITLMLSYTKPVITVQTTKFTKVSANENKAANLTLPSSNDTTYIKSDSIVINDVTLQEVPPPVGKENYKKTFYTYTEAAHFPGGAETWDKFLQRNLHADIVINKGGPAGKYKVMVSFAVDEQGRLSAIKAVHDPGYGTGAEAVRVLKSGPNWVPAKQNGKAVKCIQQQAITFSLEEQ